MKNVVLQCRTCVKCFFHPGCTSKHRIVKDKEIVRCEGPFIEIVVENERTEVKRTNTAGDGKGRL